MGKPDEIGLDACHFCGRTCTEEDYCAGCNAYVCSRCDRNPSVPYGAHSVAEHMWDSYGQSLDSDDEDYY